MLRIWYGGTRSSSFIFIYGIAFVRNSYSTLKLFIHIKLELKVIERCSLSHIVGKSNRYFYSPKYIKTNRAVLCKWSKPICFRAYFGKQMIWFSRFFHNLSCVYLIGYFICMFQILRKLIKQLFSSDPDRSDRHSQRLTYRYVVRNT